MQIQKQQSEQHTCQLQHLYCWIFDRQAY
jgi:hypothetical protein